MNEKLIAFKAAMSAAVTAVSLFLGWKGVMALAWFAVMLLDYITGTAAAWRMGTWSSEIARDGLWHKGGMIAVVLVAGLADIIIAVIGDHLPLGFSWPGLLMPLVLAWYIITELGSILENAVKMGANVPSWLTKALKISLKAVEDVAETAVDEIEAVEEAVHIDETGEETSNGS